MVRSILFKVLIIVVSVAVVAFCLKNLLFSIILAPSKPDFILYRVIQNIINACGVDVVGIEDFHVELFSATLTSQFMIHLKMAFYAGIIICFPYILYEIYAFVAPALKIQEKHYTTTILSWSYILFMMGVLLNYFIIFPLAFRFLGTYQVSGEVNNIITLNSYTDTLLALTLLMGILFELPILSWFVAKLGLINGPFMKRYRRHAFVIILTVAAIITPTTDIFTLLLVAAPIYLLYELSIIIVGRTLRS